MILHYIILCFIILYYQLPSSPPLCAAFNTLITVFKITEISSDPSFNAFDFMLSFDMVAAAAERTLCDCAYSKGCIARIVSTGAVVCNGENEKLEV